MAGAGTGPSKPSVAIPSSKAQEFLAKLSRTKRNIWDRSRPDVQQWIMQFMYMGFDEQVGVRAAGGVRWLVWGGGRGACGITKTDIGDPFLGQVHLDHPHV